MLRMFLRMSKSFTGGVSVINKTITRVQRKIVKKIVNTIKLDVTLLPTAAVNNANPGQGSC